jgi:hypothetical protein
MNRCFTGNASHHCEALAAFIIRQEEDFECAPEWLYQENP